MCKVKVLFQIFCLMMEQIVLDLLANMLIGALRGAELHHLATDKKGKVLVVLHHKTIPSVVMRTG